MSEPKPSPTLPLPPPSPDRPRLIPKLTPEELAEQNARVLALLEAWEHEDDEQEQRESWEILKKALGPDRTISNRSALR
jgi:hypothetical protein